MYEKSVIAYQKQADNFILQLRKFNCFDNTKTFLAKHFFRMTPMFIIIYDMECLEIDFTINIF